jgi:tRNA pseudouridine13 synthase
MPVDDTLLQLACNPARINTLPLIHAELRQSAEDFIVDEIPITTPDGEGEHAWLHIRKTNTNTDWLAGQIARFANVDRRHVSYAGRKDRNAQTSQWFSVHLPGKADPDWQALNSSNGNEEIEVLQASRHSKKLKRGALKGNRFRLRLHKLDGDLAVLDEQLHKLKQRGAPNYFGEQRFGHNAENIEAARQFLFERKKVNRNQKNILLSAARSLLFNAMVDARVRAGNWLQPVAGDVIQKDGRRGFFTAETIDDELMARLDAGEVHIAATLWGRGREIVSGEALEREQAVLAGFADWCEALERKGLQKDIRAMRVNVSDMSWSIEANSLEICFSLVAGAYATSVLRECLDWSISRGQST